MPWRASAKVKATPAHALFEQLEYTYGPEERALKLSGTADLQFGKTPRFESVLSARQADLDRALALPESASRLPLAALKAFIEPFASSYRPQFPVRLGIGVDAVTLASGTLQKVRGDFKLDDDGWDIETLEFRAPGFAQVRLSGRVAAAQSDTSFKGAAQIEASDPKSFLAWLEGRPDTTQRQAGLLRASGDIMIGAQQFAVERMKFEFDRKTIEGRIAYAADGARPRLDADLKAGDLDVDGVLAFGRAALEGSALARPRDVALTVDVGRATIAGVDVKGVSGTFKLDPAGITFDRVRIADLGDAAFNLNGRMEGALDAPRGTVTFDVDARGLDGTAAVLRSICPRRPRLCATRPRASSRSRRMRRSDRAGVLDRSARQQQDQARARRHRGRAAHEVRRGCGGRYRRADAAGIPARRKHQRDRRTALTGLLGLDRALNVDKRAATLSVVMRSAPGSDARIDARLNAGGLAASVNGTRGCSRRAALRPRST